MKLNEIHWKKKGQDLKRALFERIRDKEASVRSQAATALSRLQGADSEVDEVDGKTITQKLVWALRHDLMCV
ncbi:hypothetical protein F4703DRAFT_1820560 [Phycomyces blakesleeanus]